MISVNFLNIDNAKLIGRLLPFWARGRKISLLLQALLNPIISAHDTFKAWALERFIACHITAQRPSLEWYLNYKLKQHFNNEDDSFFITDGIDRTVACFSNNVWDNKRYWDNEMLWSVDVEPLVDVNANYSCINHGVWYNNRLWNNSLPYVDEGVADTDEVEVINGTNVYAPAITDTVDYNHEDYERDIRTIMSQYMINFNKINIIIANTTS